MEFLALNNLFYVLIISVIFIYIINFYMNVRKMPPGPFPLPILGNLYMLFKMDYSMERFVEHSKSFGGLTMGWLGPKPLLFIHDIRFAHNIFNNNDFNGSFFAQFSKILRLEANGVTDDPSPRYTTFRKLFTKAIRHSNDIIPEIVCRVVDELMARSTEFEARHFFVHLNKTIMFELTVGGRGTNNDPDHYKLMSIIYKINQNFAKLFPVFLFPVLIPMRIFKYFETRSQLIIVRDLLQKQFDKHSKQYYKDNKIMDFCDALLYERDVMLNDHGHLEHCLQDEQIKYLLYDFYFAASEANKHTMRWIFLFMAYYPQMQLKMKNEVMNNIGDRIPVLEDREKCVFTNAFINEVIRYRLIVLLEFPHMTTRDTNINDYFVPKGTLVFLTQNFMVDESLWESPEQFDPNRFIMDGKLDMKCFPQFQPFGVGKRKCVGEKLATNMFFLIFARLLQSSKDRLFCLPDNTPASILDPNDDSFLLRTTKQFKVVMKDCNEFL